jgi:hypothetical protein
MIIITIKASRKYIRKLDKEENCKITSSAFAIYNHKTQRHEIMIPYHCNTHTRLHELGHCFLNHCIDNRSKYPLSEYITQEIDADIFADEHMNREISIESLINIAHTAIFDYGGWVSYVFNAIVNHLKDKRYHLDTRQRSYLWGELKWMYANKRKERLYDR